MRGLVHALIELGEFTEALTVAERLATSDEGRAEVLQLRAMVGGRQLDEAAVAAAWHELAVQFPQLAQSSNQWHWFAGTNDAVARYTLDDLRQAKDGEQAQLILTYLSRRRSGEEAFALMRETAAAFPDHPGLQINYIIDVASSLLTAAECRDVRQRAAAFRQRFPEQTHGWWLQAVTAVAANDVAAVTQLATERAARTSANDVEVAMLRLWLAAQAGEHEQAYALAEQLRRQKYILAEDNRKLQLTRLNAEPAWARAIPPASRLSPPNGRSGASQSTPPNDSSHGSPLPPRQHQCDRLLLFTAVRNEMDFAPWFLNYYRQLGIEWFFVVDNLSTDGTTAYLSQQPDVTVFSCAENFAASVSGMRWINQLIRQYGNDNWCVYVDMDEQLIVPQHETRGLRAVVDDMAARGEQIMPAYMLDTYYEDAAAVHTFQPGDDPLSYSSLLDPRHYFFGSLEGCFLRVRGGVRARLFGIRDKIEKAPILRGGYSRGAGSSQSSSAGSNQSSSHGSSQGGSAGSNQGSSHGSNNRSYLYSNNHAPSSYMRVSSQCAVLLHHKLLREAIEWRKQDRDQRLVGRLQLRRNLHERYRRSGYLDGKIPLAPDTVRYRNSTQLEQLGLIGNLSQLLKNERPAA